LCAIDEILLFGIAADIGEGEDHDREVRRPGFPGLGRGGARKRIDADRPRDIL
jgi:hypothetical protein